MAGFTDAPELPDFIARELPFTRKIFEIDRGVDAGRKIHFIDHGSSDGPAIWMQHGNPTYCFLYRKIMAALGDGYRCIAPDMLGLGLSSKLPRPRDHQLKRHIDALESLFEALALDRVVFVGQDWGGPLIGGLAARHPDKVAGLVLGNTSVRQPRRPRGTAFHRFSHTPLVSDFVFRVLGFPQDNLARVQGDKSTMRGDVARAYKWPLRKFKDRAAPLGLARMVPNEPTHPSMEPLGEIHAWAKSFEGPVALVWGLQDPILGRQLARHLELFPQAKVTETQAGHFLQEEVYDELADAIRGVVERAS